uniref:Uncharacterized protein n=1 Tax=Oryza glumipatula TaxID=40148 RepID=A0A0E0AVA3_9ORYZ
MYTTKPLSAFAGHPEAASRPPAAAAAEGGCSGYLAVKSDEEGTDETRCWGLRSQPRVRGLPFPQNRVITVSDPSLGEYADTPTRTPSCSCPSPARRPPRTGTTPSSRRASTAASCARAPDEDDAAATTRCFSCRCVRDAKPRPFDPADVYQQMEIVPNRGGPKNFDLAEALGLDDPLRSRSLTTPPPPPATASAVAVGRWYTPFFYVKEDGVPLKAQMDRSTFYEIVLEQRWEEAMGGAAPAATMASKRVLVGGSVEGKQEAVTAASARTGGGGGDGVGVHASLWEKMVWEEQRGGWVADEEVGGGGVRKTMSGGAGGRSVLVERFAVRRLDGSVVVAFDFSHVNKIN